MTTENQAPEGEPALAQRITDYLAGGGLFNPEQANHDAVRDLLIECRAALAAQPEWRCPDTGRTCTAEDCGRECVQASAEGALDRIIYLRRVCLEREREVQARDERTGNRTLLDADLERSRADLLAAIDAAASNVQPKGTSDELGEVMAWADKLGALGHPDRAAAAIRELAGQRQGAPDLYVGLIERLMTLSTRLGIAYEGGVEHFGASLEDRLYAICRGTERLLDSLNATQAPAPAHPQLWRDGGPKALDPTKIQLCRVGVHSADAQAMGQNCDCQPGTCRMWNGGLKPAVEAPAVKAELTDEQRAAVDWARKEAEKEDYFGRKLTAKRLDILADLAGGSQPPVQHPDGGGNG